MKIVFLILTSIFFFSITYSASASEFSYIDVLCLSGLILLVLLLEIVICLPFRRDANLFKTLISYFIVLNIFSLNLVLVESFIVLPVILIACVALVGFFITFTILKIIDEVKLAAKAISLLLCLAISAQLLVSRQAVSEVNEQSGASLAENVRLIDFQNKPNVYLISFDALLPKAIVKRHLGLDSVAYHDVLDQKFRTFSNHFADAITTKNSLNMTLALDKNHYFEKLEEGNNYKFFPGLIRSPLFDLFKHNGYENNTIFSGHLFGARKGRYVDNYFVHWKASVCHLITKSLSGYIFFGYCGLMTMDFVLSLLRRFGVAPQDSYDDFLIDKMRKGLGKTAPQLFVSYVYSPGHTEATFDYESAEELEDFRQEYVKNSIHTLRIIRKIVDFLSNSDPGAILYIFGDHGPMLSRRRTFGQDPSFFTIDRFAVYGGVYPPFICADSFSSPYSPDFMTTLQGVNMIIRCLAGGREALKHPVAYELRGFGIEGKHRYEDFLYE